MDFQPQTIAITGATGLIGRALCESLSRRGHHIRALARRGDDQLAALPHVKVYQFDLPHHIDDQSLRGCDAIIHAAYVTRYRSLEQARLINETGTQRLVEAARSAGVPRFIFVSSTSSHRDARSFYGQSKYRIEQSLNPDRDLVIRPGLVLSSAGGLFVRMTSGNKRQWFVPDFQGGRQPMQTIHIDDLCEGFGLAVEGKAVGALTLASPERTTAREFYTAVAERLAWRVRFIPIPVGAALVALRAAEALHIRLPVSSDNLLGLINIRYWDTEPDLRRIGLHVRPLRESLAALPLK